MRYTQYAPRLIYECSNIVRSTNYDFIILTAYVTYFRTKDKPTFTIEGVNKATPTLLTFNVYDFAQHVCYEPKNTSSPNTQFSDLKASIQQES